MITLSFSQKVWLGFVVILILLSISGASSLWTLNDINTANERVNTQAIPVVKKANQVQIQLLKIANLGALGYNAIREEQIAPYRDNFERGTGVFEALFSELKELTKQDQTMAQKVDLIKVGYDDYSAKIRAMFAAKLEALTAKKEANQHAEIIIESVGGVSDALMEIAFYEAEPEHQEIMEYTVGAANQAEAKFFSVIKMTEELQRSMDAEKFATATDDYLYVIQDAEYFMSFATRDFVNIDPGGYVSNLDDAVAKLKAVFDSDETLVTYKQKQISKAQEAADNFENAKASVDESVTGLDDLLTITDKQLSSLQEILFSNLNYGFKSTLFILVTLIALATQNFNSMRLAIRKKMQDLAQLNQIGSNLAAARTQETALNEVLQAMHEKINVDKGSVFLFNKENELEAKAMLPPMSIQPDERKAMSFTKGTGVIGRAAESKNIVFVPDTSKDKNYIPKEGESAKSLLCVPLVDKDLLMGVMSFSGDIKNVAFADSDYEFSSTVAQSLVTTLKNISMVEVIEEQNRNLEHKVEQRTAALKQKNDDIANMLANMHQGLFTIEPSGLIHPEYSAYLETIFQTQKIADMHFAELLFTHAEMSADTIDATTTSVESIVGEDSMMYEFNSHLLASEIRICLPDQEDKFLDLDWDPIVDENDVVTKLMVTVRDVTELRALQAAAEEQRQELNMIGEILSIAPTKFKEFIETSNQFIAKCRTLIESTPTKSGDVLAELFRNIHTVKGNARTYGFRKITDTVHLVENTYDELRKNEESLWEPEKLLEELATAEKSVAAYATLFDEKLNMAGGGNAGAEIEPELAESLMERIMALNGQPIQSNVVSIVRDTFKALVSLQAKPINSVISDVVVSVKSLAKELGKPEPAINIDAGDILLKSNMHSMLNNIFMHVMRNAIDHGIEKPEERKSKNKPAQGIVTLETVNRGHEVSFCVSDDGKGIALTRIYQKAVEKGLYSKDGEKPSDEEIANLIFASGFSTADQVTEVSGRGVGMDAVKRFLEAEGGRIDVELTDDNENADFRAFQTVITLPIHCCHIAPQLAEAC